MNNFGREAMGAIDNFWGDDQVTDWLWLWFGLGLGIGNWNYGNGIMGLAMGHLWDSVTFGVTITSLAGSGDR